MKAMTEARFCEHIIFWPMHPAGKYPKTPVQGRNHDRQYLCHENVYGIRRRRPVQPERPDYDISHIFIRDILHDVHKKEGVI